MTKPAKSEGLGPKVGTAFIQTCAPSTLRLAFQDPLWPSATGRVGGVDFLQLQGCNGDENEVKANVVFLLKQI